MKRIALLCASALMLSFIQSVGARAMIETDAEIVNWEAAATAPGGENFEYSVTITSASLVTDDPSFPSAYAEHTFVDETSNISFYSNSIAVPLDGEVRENYFTVHAVYESTMGIFNAASNIGRIDSVSFNFYEEAYAPLTPEQALSGKFGLQLREGRVEDYQSAEDNDSGPTYYDPLEWILTWDLTIRDREHPFFLDESRLDDISNFRFIGLDDMHLESMTVTGTHFFEISNGTPYYHAANLNGSFDGTGLDLNYDNVIDLDIFESEFAVSNFVTSSACSAASPMLFSITSLRSYDGEHYMSVTTVPWVVISSIDAPLIEVSATDPDGIYMPFDVEGWVDYNLVEYSNTITIEYGEQVIDPDYFNSRTTVATEALGEQSVPISFLNAEHYVQAIVTFDGVTIAAPVPGVDTSDLTGYIFSDFVDMNDCLYQDVIGETYYSEFHFSNEGSAIQLKEEYWSSGYVQDVTITLTPVDIEPDSGSGPTNTFYVALIDTDGTPIEETERIVTMDDSYVDYTVSYDYVSGLYPVGFQIACNTIEDSVYTLKVYMEGYEYVPGYYSYEMQAMTYATYFDELTYGLQGSSEDGICELPLGGEWDILSDEYSFMNSESQLRLKSNHIYADSIFIGVVMERYEYVINNSNSTFTDFMGILGPGTNWAPLRIEADTLELLLLVGIGIIAFSGYFILFKKRRI